MDVGEAFLHESKQDQFNLTRNPAEIVRDRQLDLHAVSLLEALYIPAQCVRQSGFIKKGRIEQVGHRSYFLA